MKLMTLNTHSLEEPDYESKLHAFAQGTFKEKPDVIALQEVNQTQTAPPAAHDELRACGYVPCAGVPRGIPDSSIPGGGASGSNIPGSGPSPARLPVIRNDNHAYRLAKIWSGLGFPCSWTWTPVKTGYGKYDEGLALFSRLPILSTHEFYITGARSYDNWKTRKILGAGISTKSGTEYFYSVHMGWWDDTAEPFKDQWKRICQGLMHTANAPVWLMGDFNSPAHVRGQGRDLILESGWFDSYSLSEQKDGEITVSQAIDGWRERGELPGMRIDYIWASRPIKIKTCRTIFNGTDHPVVSDHFGVITEYEPGHCP